MNQSEQVDELLRSGYLKSATHNGFIWMFRRVTGKDKNFLYPEYHEITVMPNGRIAEGHHQKWAKIRRRNLAKFTDGLVTEINEDEK